MSEPYLKSIDSTVEGQSMGWIAEELSISRDSAAQYLGEPVCRKPTFQRDSKLDPFKGEIVRLLEIYPQASSEVIRLRLLPLGFDGGNTILKDYLRTVRPNGKKRRPFSSASEKKSKLIWNGFRPHISP